MFVSARTETKKLGFLTHLSKDLRKNATAYFLILPTIIYFLVFSYKPIYGVIIAFKDYSPMAGILGSEWATNSGMQHFLDFFGSYYFTRLLKNTLVISLSSIVFGFPAPIILALLINEIKGTRFKRIVQTVSYMPHFISLVVVCGLVSMFVAEKGIVVHFLTLFGFNPVNLLAHSEYFVPVYVLSGIWQEIGWGSIIYLAALTSIDVSLYEATEIDGANRWKQTIHITLPGISSTIIILLLLRLGNLLGVGFEKIILLYNDGIYDTADVISTFVYRKGLKQFEWSYSSAVGLFNSVINFIMIVIFNRISKKFSDVSLW